MTQTSPAETNNRKKWESCDGRQLRKMVQAGLIWLDENHQHVNSLNVFPVPDGDTGTNMLLTMRAAFKRVEDSGEVHVGRVAEQIAQGALMGARGNSGVILSQIWRGLARGLKGKRAFDAADLADALQEAADTAYKGVMKPVEGTILTVIRAGAEEATRAAPEYRNLYDLLAHVLERCRTALAHTPEQLPILKQAGVVDSGGQGLVYILEGMLRYTNGLIDLNGHTNGAAPAQGTAAPAQALAAPEGGQLDYPYDVQFILLGRQLNVYEVRNRIDSMGDSTVVVGDESTIKVHIHVKDPGEPISYGASLGIVTDVVVENMQVQMEEIIAGGAGGSGTAAALPALEPGQIGIVAVAPGPGLAHVLTSMGVTVVVDGGQTNNPSTEEIFQAIQDVPSDRVVLLPNNKNIILAAEAARDLSPKTVSLVPTRTVPQGISALLGYNPDGDLEEVTAAMDTAARDVVTGEVTIATRAVEIDGVAVNEGDCIGMLDGRLCAAAADIPTVIARLLAEVDLETAEIISLYYGSDVTPDEAKATAALITTIAPNVEVELLAGGQPHYHYIFGIE